MRRFALCALVIVVSLSSVDEVRAEKIGLKGLSIVAVGIETVDSAFGSEQDPIALSLLFNTEGARTYLVFDDEGTTLMGKLERRGKNGRKLFLELNKSSRKEIKDAIRDVAGFDFSIKIEKAVFRVVLGNDDMASIKVKVRGTGRTLGGITVEATYKIVAEGPIEIGP